MRGYSASGRWNGFAVTRAAKRVIPSPRTRGEGQGEGRYNPDISTRGGAILGAAMREPGLFAVPPDAGAVERGPCEEAGGAVGAPGVCEEAGGGTGVAGSPAGWRGERSPLTGGDGDPPPPGSTSSQSREHSRTSG